MEILERKYQYQMVCGVIYLSDGKVLEPLNLETPTIFSERQGEAHCLVHFDREDQWGSQKRPTSAN